MKNAIALIAFAGLASVANADVIISEVLGSTTSSDAEYIEIYNAGGSSVDLTGWSIELWDSDAASLGGADGGSPYAITGLGSLASGETYTLGNANAIAGVMGEYAGFGAVFDQVLGVNSIENSSYTMILVDALDNAVFSVFVTDGGAGDIANRAGVAIAADLSVGPDGSFLPAGFRVDDADLNFSLIDFNDFSAPGTNADPGVANFAPIPAPSALALLGLGGVVAGRRRR